MLPTDPATKAKSSARTIARTLPINPRTSKRYKASDDGSIPLQPCFSSRHFRQLPFCQTLRPGSAAAGCTCDLHSPQRSERAYSSGPTKCQPWLKHHAFWELNGSSLCGSQAPSRTSNEFATCIADGCISKMQICLKGRLRPLNSFLCPKSPFCDALGF